MNAGSARAFLLTLPNVVETVSDSTAWGNKLVFRVGDRSVGRMFAQIDFEPDGAAILSFACSPESFRELIERNGIIPAPYRARLNWIALMEWNAIRDSELKALLKTAREITFAKLPKRIRASLNPRYG